MMLSYDNRPAMAQAVLAQATLAQATLAAAPPTSDILQQLSTSPSNTRSNPVASTRQQSKSQHHDIWLITGPAGCGKSTVAQYLAKALDLPYIEGDEFHPKANVDKMAQGIPLTDADRWDWLTALREESLNRLSSGSQGVVLTCSALKRKYRDVIRVAPYYDHHVLVHFVYLHASEETLMARVSARKDHFMGARMVHSQFSILQPPSRDETDVISIDVSGSIEGVEKEALSRIRAVIEEEL